MHGPVAPPEPQFGAARVDEPRHRLANGLPDAVEAEVEKFGNLRQKPGGMRFGRSFPGDRLKDWRRFAVRADERHEHASDHSAPSSSWSSKADKSASLIAASSNTRCSRPSRSKTPSAVRLAPKRTRAARLA